MPQWIRLAGRHLSPFKAPFIHRLIALAIVAIALVILPAQTLAQTVTTTMTGTVASGSDDTGVFGAPNPDLSGLAFKLVYTHNITNGTTATVYCDPGTDYTASQAGDTATLQIGSGTYLFGSLPQFNAFTIDAERCIQPAASTADYDLDHSGPMGETYVDGGVGPAVESNWATDQFWYDSYTNSALNGTDGMDFYIGTTVGTGGQSASGYLTTATYTVSGLMPTNPNAKSNGNPANAPGCMCTASAPQNSSDGGLQLSLPASTGQQTMSTNGQGSVGEPIMPSTGNVFDQVMDYSTVGQNPLQFIRYYNSMGNATGMNTYATTLGVDWRSNYDRYLQITSTTVVAERADGQFLSFTLSGTTWVSDSDIDVKLTNSGTTWTLTDANDTVETYTASGAKGTLQSIVLRNGYTQTMTYTSGLLTKVTDSYSRTLNLTYISGLLNTVTTPDTLVLTYGFTAVTGGGSELTSVAYNTSPVTSQTYNYTNPAFPYALTSITDELGQNFASWTYDNAGRGTSSQLGAGANLTTVAYNANGTTTVTNALGVADTYTFTMLNNTPKTTGISRAATATTPAATESFGYDSNGYLNSMVDWNGNHTTYVNNSHGDPTTINEAVGSTVARTTTISYGAPTGACTTFVHLPCSIVTSGLTSSFTYDAHGNPLTRTDLDTTTNTIPYSTGGQSRVFTWTWSATGQETSIQLPRTDVTAKTSFTYTGGTLTLISDALAHTTQITVYTGGGLPQTVIDQNGVTTTLVYDKRLNLNTSTLHAAAGNLVTTFTHDAANELTAVQLPDNSKLTYGYDTAHRLNKITDLFSNTINYTLNALGDKTLTQIKNSSAVVKASNSATFDALGRMLTYVGGMSQTTTYTYDKDSNVLTIAPPSPSGTITQTWDALNRLATHVDPSPGGTTTFTYDAHDRPLTVKDANLNTTTYVNDGFSERTQTASPDSGTTVYHYDADRNVTQIVLAGTLTANMTYDALDRPLATTYPSDTTLNVSRTYDQTTGHGDGIGHLTSATDQPGSLALTYDERGNVTAESRVITSLGTLATATTFDGASRVSSITYPSTTLVTYTRDTMGRVTGITAKPPGASSASNIATSITYEPFGPETALTFGNGITGAYGYDNDYRPTTRVDLNGSTNVLNLTYAYYTNNSVHTLTDAVTAANTQTLGYDALDRMTSAVSGTGGYGTWGWTWDKVNNVATQVINGTTTTFNLTSGSNKLSTVVTGSTTQTFVHTSAGNVNTIKVGSTTQETLTYNQANELASAASATTTGTYKFDLAGKRLIKTISGVTNPITYQYAQTGQLLAENDLHSGTTADYIYLNGRPIGEVNPNGGALYYTHTDRLGTPQKLTNSTKATAWSTTYNPFGTTIVVTGSLTTQSLRLPGQTYDSESGYSHNAFRDYSGTFTRYVESDPVGLLGGMNTYQFANSNPSKYVDLLGLSGKVNLFGPSDPANDSYVEGEPTISHVVIVGGHGNPISIVDPGNPNGNLDATDIESRIDNARNPDGSPVFQPGDQIWLQSCDTGGSPPPNGSLGSQLKPLAQSLADKYDTTVWAPSSPSQFVPLPGNPYNWVVLPPGKLMSFCPGGSCPGDLTPPFPYVGYH